MMCVDQFEMFRCTNPSIMVVSRSQTSLGSALVFLVEILSRQPKEVLSRKHRAHCLNAVPDYWIKIAEYCK